MNSLIARELAVKQQRANSVKSSQSDFEARPFIVQGKFMCDGAGEIARDLIFPVTFTEEPLFYFGSKMEVGQPIEQGSFPMVSATVISYVEDRKGSETILYKGARIAVVTTGLDAQKIWLHWHFVGTALVNPVGGDVSTDGTI